MSSHNEENPQNKKNVTTSKPNTESDVVSLPPVEGRNDLTGDERPNNTSTSTPPNYPVSQDPVEGRTDIGRDTQQRSPSNRKGGKR